MDNEYSFVQEDHVHFVFYHFNLDLANNSTFYLKVNLS